MTRKVILFALGGHIATQNASFKRLIDKLEPKGYEFYGAKDGFNAFNTCEVYRLKAKDISDFFAGFVAGSGRASLFDQGGNLDYRKLSKAEDFFKRGNFEVAVGSGGDDHGKQMDLLSKNISCLETYVINKTMDNDLGGTDGIKGAPFTDFTNGFHTACDYGIRTLRDHLSGAWTNNCPYLIGHFGRETNWVGLTISYFGDADLFIYGELSEGTNGHPAQKIHDAILKTQDKNEKLYGRRFAMVVVPEGTIISGVDHLSKDLIDAHGHYKLNPEVLVVKLKEGLEKSFGMKTHTAGITYEMRNVKPSNEDLIFARKSADAICDAILRGEKGVESTFKINGQDINDITAGVLPIEQVSQKRYSNYYEKNTLKELVNKETFELTDEIGKYYGCMFKKIPKEELLPKKLDVIKV